MWGLSLTALGALFGSYWIVWRLSPGNVPDLSAGDEAAPDALQSEETEQDTQDMQAVRRRDYRDTSSPRVGPSAVGSARPMVRRVTEGSGEAAYQRLARRTEEAQAAANERVEALFDNMLGEVRELRRDVQGVAQDQNLVARRMDDLELQINMTRDEVQKRALNPAPSQIASAKKAIEDKLKTWQARVALWTAGLGLVSILASQIPDAARFVDRFLDFLQGKEVSAVDVVIPKADPAKVPEK